MHGPTVYQTNEGVLMVLDKDNHDCGQLFQKFHRVSAGKKVQPETASARASAEPAWSNGLSQEQHLVNTNRLEQLTGSKTRAGSFIVRSCHQSSSSGTIFWYRDNGLCPIAECPFWLLSCQRLHVVTASIDINGR